MTFYIKREYFIESCCPSYVQLPNTSICARGRMWIREWVVNPCSGLYLDSNWTKFNSCTEKFKYWTGYMYSATRCNSTEMWRTFFWCTHLFMYLLWTITMKKKLLKLVLESFLQNDVQKKPSDVLSQVLFSVWSLGGRDEDTPPCWLFL